jgi:signal transduction histidine kinase/CheY-like chemotaxis protein
MWKTSYLLCIVAGLLILLSLPLQQLCAQPIAQKGVIDLSSFQIDDQSSVRLNGEWAFYWNELLEPSEIQYQQTPEFVNFPHLWNDDPNLSSYGYATYTLQIIKADTYPPLALTIPDLYTAYSLFINGEVVSRNGEVATTEEKYTPFWLPKTISMEQINADTLNLVLQISNFKHSKGGIRLPIILGSKEHLEWERTIEIGYILLLTGCLFMIGLIFLGLYLFGRHEEPMIYFAAVCFVFSYRVFGTELYPLHYLFPELPWLLTIKAEYFSLYFTGFLFCIFVKKLYPAETQNKIIYPFAGIFGLLSVISILFPAFYFTKLINLFFTTLPLLITYVTWVYIKATINKREGATFALASTVIVFGVFLHNALEYFTYVDENLLLNFIGFFSFFFLQSLILSYRFTNSLSKARIKAEEAAKAKSQFLSTMSHEIRTPLNAVIGLSELLAETDSEEEKKEFAKHIKKSGENLLEILNNVLDYSKFESTGIEKELKPVNLSQVIHEINNLLTPLSLNKNLSLETDISTDIPDWVLTDETHIKQILINLAGNAIKFTSEGSVRISLQKNSDPQKKGNLTFIIKDTGHGISRENIHRLFKSFTQLDASRTRQHGGTGLGLAISKKLVEALGGEIWFESELNKGAEFYFTIQAKETSNQDSTVEAPSRVVEAPVEDSHSPRTLVVEDNLLNQKVITKILEKINLKTDIASNGKEALEMLDSSNYNLIFMDMEMPVMDGLEATRQIRKNLPSERQPIIIAMTANAFMEDRERCLEAGMNDFISKPISIDKIKSMLNHWLK